MKLLLDTHILVWSLLEPERLSKPVAEEIEKPANELWVSPVTTWEILMLVEKGRIVIKGGGDPADWLREVYDSIFFKEALLNHEIAFQSRKIDLPQQDPADRFLAATALVYDLTLVTADKRLINSKQIHVLPNI